MPDGRVLAKVLSSVAKASLSDMAKSLASLVESLGQVTDLPVASLATGRTEILLLALSLVRATAEMANSASSPTSTLMEMTVSCSRTVVRHVVNVSSGRHPDVVRGVIPPLPPLSRQNRNMRAMGPGFAPFDPAFRQQQYQQQMQFLQHQRMAAAQAQQGQAPASTEPNDEVKPAVEDEAPAADSEKQGEDTVPAATTSPAVTVLPAKPTVTMPTLLRSASQPGVQRVHANGVASRSHSPAPSNVSFHGNGHPRRAGRVPNVNGARSSSSGPEKKPTQRVPKPDEFPVLGTPTSEKKEPVWGMSGKTAAQVLQAPAPVKPVVKVSQPIEEDAQVSKHLTIC